MAACGGGRNAPEPTADSGVLTGRVRVAGSTPLERILIEPEGEGVSVEVAGDLRPEIRRLGGARIRVTGSMSESGRLRVSDYTILEIAGRRPRVGVLAVRNEEVTLMESNGRSTPLRNVPAELGGRQGAKVWVVLDSAGGVQGYGILRER